MDPIVQLANNGAKDVLKQFIEKFCGIDLLTDHHTAIIYEIKDGIYPF